MAAYFTADGYVRGPIPLRQRREGWRFYKKGWELRISLPDDRALLEEVQHLITLAGWRVAEPFRKHTRIVQPIYRREHIEEILAACEREA